MNQIPVLLLNFNRPRSSRRLLGNLSKIKPKKIYVSIDGHRNDVAGEKIKVDEVESVFKNIDWECDLRIRRNDRNLGLRGAVKSALDWFYGENEFGIVFEDDVEFDENFFIYCQRFSNYGASMKIGALSGNNLLAHMFTEEFFQPKYLLAKVFHCWGWASWSDRWKNYDDDIEYDDEFFDKILPKYLNYDSKLLDFWYGIRAVLKENKVSTWAWRFILSSWKHDLHFLTPPQNLTTNYGFGIDSTHTSAVPFYIPSMKIGKFVPYNESDYMIEPSSVFEKIEEKFLLGIDRTPLLL